MSVNVPQLIVHVEEATKAFLGCGYWPITRQDIFVELQVCRSFGEVQKPWPFAGHHHDFVRRFPTLFFSSLTSSVRPDSVH